MLKVENLHVHYPVGRRMLRAVDGVSFDCAKGETLGIVGESGCGKSTTGRAILGLVPRTSGSVTFDGQDPLAGSSSDRRAYRRRVQMVFQDPHASLSPRMSVGSIVSEPLEIHGIGGTVAERRERVAGLLAATGLPADAAERYPHEFSGGQRQRIGIARALALDPELIVLDEPVSALDISVRAQIANLLAELQSKTGVAYVFIGHDLSLIRHVAHRVAVMYLGRIVETGPTDVLYRNPSHPYTRSLFASAPIPDPNQRTPAPSLEGDPPSPLDVPTGCRFRSRCTFAVEACAHTDPVPVDLGDGQRVACLRAGELPVWRGR